MGKFSINETVKSIVTQAEYRVLSREPDTLDGEEVYLVSPVKGENVFPFPAPAGMMEGVEV